MTFSIVGLDKENSEVGFAIASCSWNSGLVCKAITEVGAIASQARGNLKFLSEFFEQLEQKKSLKEILDYFKKIDRDIETRQIGMITFGGETLAFTGEKCTQWAGHKTGKNYACQGNILIGSSVIDSMTTAFEKTEGTLTNKLYAALQAGDNAGGDARGKQSARLLVMKLNGGYDGSDIAVDITIEDHDEPVKEIGRILNIQNNLMILYRYYGELQQTDDEGKKVVLAKASQFLKDKKEARYIDIWTEIGSLYYELGETERAIYHLRTALEISPNLRKSLELSFKKDNMPEEIIGAVLITCHRSISL